MDIGSQVSLKNFSFKTLQRPSSVGDKFNKLMTYMSPPTHYPSWIQVSTPTLVTLRVDLGAPNFDLP